MPSCWLAGCGKKAVEDKPHTTAWNVAIVDLLDDVQTRDPTDGRNTRALARDVRIQSNHAHADNSNNKEEPLNCNAMTRLLISTTCTDFDHFRILITLILSFCV